MKEETPVGQRIAYYRHQRELSQATLAQLVGRSGVWLSMVERGKLPMDSISVLRLMANVLKVNVWDLYPKLGLPPNGGGPLDPPNGVPALARAVMASVPRDYEPYPIIDLRLAVEAAMRERFADGKLTSPARYLPGLVVASRDAAARDEPGAWEVLAQVYRVTSSLADDFGDVRLEWIAAREGVDAAQRSGDRLLVASARRRLTKAVMHGGWFDAAASEASDAADAVAPTSATSPAGWALWGSLHLTGAVAAARAKDTAGAERMLRDARSAADRVGEREADYWELFSPANVGAHEVAVALDGEDPVKALRAARRVDLDAMTTAERPATFLIEVARAHHLRGEDGAAVAALLEAERYAFDVARYSVKAHEVIRVCLHRNSATPGVRGLARRLDVAD